VVTFDVVDGRGGFVDGPDDRDLITPLGAVCAVAAVADVGRAVRALSLPRPVVLWWQPELGLGVRL
jgi:hypothetical protein